MRQFLYSTAVVVFILASLGLAVSVHAQNGTEAEITFMEEKKKKARQQLRRLLSEYDLDPWIITQDVQIKVGEDPHSHPILTLNTKYLNDDVKQLSIFLHEQAHWLPDAKREAAIPDLRSLYPEIPGLPDTEGLSNEKRRKVEDLASKTYNHLIVAWAELDAMTELVGEEQARRTFKEKVDDLTTEPYSALEKRFRWYNNRVLKDPQEIGAVLAKHDLVITPEKGCVLKRGRNERHNPR